MKVWTRRAQLLPKGSRLHRRSLLRIILLTALAGNSVVRSAAQGKPTATRTGDLQVGGGLTFARSGYNFTPLHLIGGTVYATFDIRRHWGAEFDFHHLKSTEDSTIYERTYEIGPRFFLTRGAIAPYAKVTIGRGVYNFAQNRANLAYNVYAFGGGADLALKRSINLRLDYEYQNWAGFPLGTLHPSVITVGAAYHFHE